MIVDCLVIFCILTKYSDYDSTISWYSICGLIIYSDCRLTSYFGNELINVIILNVN